MLDQIYARLDEIKARLADITPGNWEAITPPTYAGRVRTDGEFDNPAYDGWIAEDMSHGDAQLLAAAPEDIQWLLDRVEELLVLTHGERS